MADRAPADRAPAGRRPEQAPVGDQPSQSQPYPGRTDAMDPRPRDDMAGWRGSELLRGRVALVTGGDSGIGRAVAVCFAKEGADVAVAYLDEHDDAGHTAELVQAAGRRCLLLAGDLAEEEHCEAVVARTAAELGGLGILVNNAATQRPVESLRDLSTEQWRRTFGVNIDAMFWVTRAALAHLRRGDAIINTASVNGLRGNRTLVDYSAAKGAVIAFTYSMAQSLVDEGIRVNAVAPGPVWTPLIPATFPPDRVGSFGSQTPMGRAAQPDEIAPSYLFFASDVLSSYYSGEVLAPIGGEVHPG